MTLPIDPAMVTTSPEWKIGGVGGVDPGSEAQVKPGFGAMLGNQIQQLQGLQENAATAAQGLADGTVKDTNEVVMAVEKARLSMQLATQLRERGVTALQEVLRTQV